MMPEFVSMSGRAHALIAADEIGNDPSAIGHNGVRRPPILRALRGRDLANIPRKPAPMLRNPASPPHRPRSLQAVDAGRILAGKWSGSPVRKAGSPIAIEP
jgi:hypothetical protein